MKNCKAMAARLGFLTLLAFLSVALFAEDSPRATGKVDISFQFTRQNGWATNQYAVWIEDANGNVIKTLFVPKFTGKGGWEKREDTVSEWVKRSNVAGMPKEELSAITGATPRTGDLVYTWDLTDKNGSPVPAGRYTFFVEGTLRWKNRVLWSGSVDVGGKPNQADAQAVFTGDSDKERAMITGVRAKYLP